MFYGGDRRTENTGCEGFCFEVAPPRAGCLAHAQMLDQGDLLSYIYAIHPFCLHISSFFPWTPARRLAHGDGELDPIDFYTCLISGMRIRMEEDWGKF